jgi:hypothetical protein
MNRSPQGVFCLHTKPFEEDEYGITDLQRLKRLIVRREAWPELPKLSGFCLDVAIGASALCKPGNRTGRSCRCDRERQLVMFGGFAKV